MAPQKKLGPKRTKTKLPKMGPPYKCPTCKKMLSDNSAYHQHVQLHADARPFSCDQCSYKCKIKKYLSRHVKKVHGKAAGPECPVCKKVFHYGCNLKSHMRVHTGEKPYQCEVCSKAFSSSYCLSMHKLIHTQEKPYQCKFCDYACRDSSTLRRHQERHMGIFKKFPCKQCPKIFLTSRTLKIHTDEVHYGLDTRKYHCTRDKCDKAFKTQGSLSIHVKAVHDKALRIECEICGRIISKNNVTSHLQSHVDIRPYKCSYSKCSKRFKDKGTLKKHVMIHYPQYHYRCALCDCRFPRKSRLREHTMKHVAEGGYSCDYCGVSFGKKSYITSHIRLKHGPNGERFICDECGLVNYSKKSIILHLRYGHGTDHDRKCAICPVTVQNSNLLIEHYFLRHQIKFVARKLQKTPENVQNTRLKQIVVKAEPIELSAEFDFNYEVQKVELDEHVSDHEYADTVTTLEYSTRVLEEDLSRSHAVDTDGATENEFDNFFTKRVMHPPTRQDIPDPEYVDVETTLAYSEGVLKEDISRGLLERKKQDAPDNSFDEFLQQVLTQPKPKALPKKKLKKVDKRKLETVKETVKKMLSETRQRKEVESLEKFRQSYNMRIQSLHKSWAKKEPPKKITYFKKSEKIEDNNHLQNDNLSNSNDKISDVIEDNEVSNDSLNDETDKSNEKLSDINTSETESYKIDILHHEPHQEHFQNDEASEPLIQDELENVLLQNGTPDEDKSSNHTFQNDNSNVDILQNDNLDNEMLQKDTLQNVIPNNHIIHNSLFDGISQNDELVNNLLQSNNVDDKIKDDKLDNLQESNKQDNDDIASLKILQHKDKPDEISVSDRNDNDKYHENNITSDKIEIIVQQNDTLDEISESERNDNSHENIISSDNIEIIVQRNDTLDEISESERNDKSHEKVISSDKITAENTEKVQQKDKIKNDEYDIPIAFLLSRKRKSKRKKRKVIRFDKNDDDGDKNDSDYVCTGDDKDNTINTSKNGKMIFDGHECYICFKLFKTKEDLKSHCSEHFDVCNEKMLKKCPFCGYVTNLNITRHVQLVHKINLKYAYGHIREKHNNEGSKYVFECNDDRELEVIPSVSNLNKIACMKNEEKMRKNRNVFMGKTKLVKKGDQWVVVKEAVNLTHDYLLPEFSEEEYRNIKIEGDSYLDRMKKLNFLAKKRGAKMLYPCQGCEKVCQTMSALCLHNRKHESNPKQYKPKIWVNRHIEYKTKMRKNKKFKKPVPPVKDTGKTLTPSDNRFQSPKPVKNKHKCDKKLIEFYKSNIKGGDIEFWQFLKIFNKMSRENVNDFDDLENRNDLHFGVHCLTQNEPVKTANVVTEPVVTEIEPVHAEKEPVPSKNYCKSRKNITKKFTRAIMISKKEYMRRKEIKDQMRKRIEESRV